LPTEHKTKLSFSTPAGFTNNNPAPSDLFEYMKRAGQNLDEIQESSI
jgi:hypothetical protein